MKKQCCTIIFVFITVKAFTQQNNSLKFGIKAGLAFSKSNIGFIDTANSFSSSGKTGIILGVFLNAPISSQFILQPAILYVRKGYKETTFGSNYNQPISYMKLPLNLLYTLPSENNKFYVGAGVSPAFKLNNEYSGDEVKDVDIGLNVIGGFMIPIGFSFNINYTHGLNNVSNNKNYFPEIRNRYYSVTVGYEF